MSTDTNPEGETQDRASMAADIFAGAGIGALLGTLMGMTTTPVVATVVAAITSVLAVLLGLDGKSRLPLPKVNGLRIGAFGFLTIAGLMLGIYMRVNSPLAMDPKDAMKRWEGVFDKNMALTQQMMVYERTGLKPDAVSYGLTGEAAQNVTQNETMSQQRSGALFNTMGTFDPCNDLSPAALNPTALLAAYDAPGTPEVVKQVGSYLNAVPQADRTVALTTAHRVLCDIKRAEDKAAAAEAGQ